MPFGGHFGFGAQGRQVSAEVSDHACLACCGRSIAKASPQEFPHKALESIEGCGGGSPSHGGGRSTFFCAGVLVLIEVFFCSTLSANPEPHLGLKILSRSWVEVAIPSPSLLSPPL